MNIQHIIDRWEILANYWNSQIKPLLGTGQATEVVKYANWARHYMLLIQDINKKEYKIKGR